MGIRMPDVYKRQSLVCVLLASKLSGTFQSAQLAKELSGYDEIYIVDSQQALCGQIGRAHV